MKRIACPALLLACLPLAALAQEQGALDETPVATPKEPVVISDYQPASEGPEIVIRPGEKEVFYEYRVNGQLMEIKVVPEAARSITWCRQTVAAGSGKPSPTCWCPAG